MPIKFSIITPVYNGAQYISTCIEAIANCDYDLKYVEHIVVDDGSTDETKQICTELSKKYSHIKFISKTNGNWGSVINYVKNKRIATGDYVLVIDADDKINKGVFAFLNNKLLKKQEKPDILAGSFYLWNGKKRKTKVPSYYFLFKHNFTKKRKMQYFSPLLLPFSTYIRKDIFYKIQDLREKIPYQDNILYTSAFYLSKTIFTTFKSFTFYWQQRGGNTMSTIVTEKGIKHQLSNLQFYSDNDLIEPFFFVLIGLSKLRKHLKNNNIKYSFKKKKPDLSGFPWYARPFLKMMFTFKVKKLIK